jgi:hypothetical protein
MKSPQVLLTIAVVSLSALAFAQSDAQKPMDHSAAQKPVVQSETQKSFETLKSLSGVWNAKLTLDPPMPGVNDNNMPSQISIRVTSRGKALVHEMYVPGAANDPGHFDHPVTMLYVDADRLNLVHYCDAGNRPHMVGRTSPDGKTVEFDFAELSGGNTTGHMHHALFTIIDENHHIEEWTYAMPKGKSVRAHFDLQRTKDWSGLAGK